MKFLIASDIHGDSSSAEIIIEKFEKFKCDKIILLGDILYHGPRNDLPENYNPKKVIEILNKYSNKIVAVQGNCDAEVDQMVLDFVLSKNQLLKVGEINYLLTHGHEINAEKPISSDNKLIVLHGHTHIIKKDVVENVTYINIGSITLPKNGTPKCFAILDEQGVIVYDIEDNVIEF